MAGYYGTGRRKKSIARVRLVPGTGVVTINKRDIDDYFGLDTLKLSVRQPLEALGLTGKFDVIATVVGGDVTGQAGAIRHGIARALLQADDENRAVLKKSGYLTRDPRMKERKKYGLKAARRAPQFSKREFREQITHYKKPLETQCFQGFSLFLDSWKSGVKSCEFGCVKHKCLAHETHKKCCLVQDFWCLVQDKKARKKDVIRHPFPYSILLFQT